MFNPDREWVLMEQHRRSQIRQACAERLKAEALRDHVSMRVQLFLKLSEWLIIAGLKLRAHWNCVADKPHRYISTPQDKVYS